MKQDKKVQQKKEHKQVIKNIRNVTRHRNGQSVKSRWEWQLLISSIQVTSEEANNRQVILTVTDS